MLTRDLLAFVRVALPPPPAGVLEVGAGNGELARALAQAGYEVTAIDPAAEAGSYVEKRALLDAKGSFDAAVAVVSLHHIEPLEESCAHLASLVGPGAPLVIDEIDIDRCDERAVQWWLSQRRTLGFAEDGHEPSQMLERLRDHIHSVEAVLAALRPYFELGPAVRGPYLHRWELRASLRQAEVDLIADGLLPAVGCRLVAIRKR